MSLGTILLIILVIALLGGFSGIGGGPFYGGRIVTGQRPAPRGPGEQRFRERLAPDADGRDDAESRDDRLSLHRRALSPEALGSRFLQKSRHLR